MPANPDRSSVRDLINAACCDQLTDEQAAAFEKELAISPQTRQQYFAACEMAMAMRFCIKASRAIDRVEEELAAGPPQRRPPILGFLASVVRLVPGGEFVVGGLVMLAVTGAVWGVIHFAGSNQQAEDEKRTLANRLAHATAGSIGSLVTESRTRWSHKSSAPVDSAARIGQRYELASGWANVELTSGTRVAVEGPAVWMFASDRRLQLTSGKLVATVPHSGIGFTVATPTAEIVDLGTEFGVEVDTAGKTDVHVLKGAVEVTPASEARSRRRGHSVVAGQAVRISADGRTASSVPLDRARFENARFAASGTAGATANVFRDDQPIWLGNLFDDRPGTPLASAMRTDTFRATADFNDLAVDRVLYGGGPVKEIGGGLRFDLENLGWHADSRDVFTNDTWCNSAGGGPADLAGGLRLNGTPFGQREPKADEGIGAPVNALISFDLDDIRAAGRLEGRKFEFICDRAGSNDDVLGEEPNYVAMASIHMAVLVSTKTRMQAALVDGIAVQVAERDGIWSVTSPIGEPLRADGRFVSFRVPLAADAKYLTLLSTSVESGAFDHPIWVRARLEVTR